MTPLPPSPTPSSPRNGRKYTLETELVFSESTDQYNSSSMPIYQTATFKQNTDLNNPGSSNEYDYSRSGNPTRTHLERHISKIMNARRSFAISSGMGALDVITRLLKPGDQVIAGDDVYGGTNRLLNYLQNNGGIIVHHIDTTDLKTVEKFLNSDTKLILLETPTNPLIKIIPIAEISKLCKKLNFHEKITIVVDNTMMSPMFQNPLELGAHISYESATKYLSGHHDIMAGVISVNDSKLADDLYFIINSTGCALGPFDSWLLIRGIKTLAVRIQKQQSNAQKVAEFLESNNFIVHYPGLESHPQYKLHWAQATGAGAVLSFETGDVQLSERIVEATKLWAISVSFGCVNSLISMPCKMSHASIDPKVRKERALPEDLIRLCVGIENPLDLIQDLQSALISAGAIKFDNLRID